MVELEVDGNKVQVPEGSMVMHAADKLDIYVPHFCYHKKLSIAANCRMCLVDIEKAPKPMPACATPVSNGMKVFTRSERAIKAQKGVMEFLLINHPLDCPICDQGGECQLQDLAVGYGASSSRYSEEKRVVFHKPLGPLISAEEMSRCIHCTRCVRFGQEIAGVMELGMGGRGEHSEIMSFVGRSIESELSGNMIDVCPVGALTSKPFRYSARTWELSRRKSVAPHDSLGSNIVVQVKNNEVMRVVPLEDETLNECWISDKDRFSYEGLNSDDRLKAPMIKQGGVWREVAWQTALEYCAHALATVRKDHGANHIGALVSPHSTLEELYLAAQLIRGLGGENIDHRLRQYDFSGDGKQAGAPWLGIKVAQVATLDRMLLIGSFLRKDQPLFAARIRQRVKRGGKVAIIHAVDDDLLMPIAAKAIVAPSQWPALLEQIVVAAAAKLTKPVLATLSGVVASDAAKAIANNLCGGEKRIVWLGSAVLHHAQYARIHALAQELCQLTGATLGVLPEAANSVGAALVQAMPGVGGVNARQMVEKPLRAYLLLNVEPSLDHSRPQQAVRALEQAQTVIALSMFKSVELANVADCVLPLAPFTETAGTFVNAEGRVQSFTGVVRPVGEARPGWKILRVLGNMLHLPGFEFESAEAVRAQALVGGVDSQLSNQWRLGAELFTTTVAVTGVNGTASAATAATATATAPTGATAALASTGAASTAVIELERIAEVPIYSADPLVRRAASLQKTREAATPTARMNAATLARIGVSAGQRVKVGQGESGESVLQASLDGTVADGVVRIAAAATATATLSALTGTVRVAKY